MPAAMDRKKLDHVAAGLLGSFISRNNDVDGYWALGMMYRDADPGSLAVSLDLLAPDASPSTAGTVARRYAQFLQHAMQAAGFTMDHLARAHLAIQFDAAPPADVLPLPGIGDPFACTIVLESNEAGVRQRVAFGRCQRHSDGRFSRSNRASRAAVASAQVAP